MTKKGGFASGFDRAALPPPRVRTEVAPDAIEAFVADERAPQPPSPPPSGTSRRVAPSKKRGATRGTRINCYVPSDIARAMDEVAFRESRSLTDAVTEALSFWLKKTGRPR